MGLIKCPDCRCTISDDVEYCPACGKRITTKTIYPGVPIKTPIPVYCPWCGQLVPAGERKCPGCGSPAKISYRPTQEKGITIGSSGSGASQKRKRRGR